MKLPRFRFTVRRLMILVALTAGVLASWRLADAWLGWTPLTHVAWGGAETYSEVFSPWPGRVAAALVAGGSGGWWYAAAMGRGRRPPGPG